MYTPKTLARCTLIVAVIAALGTYFVPMFYGFLIMAGRIVR